MRLYFIDLVYLPSQYCLKPVFLVQRRCTTLSVSSLVAGANSSLGPRIRCECFVLLIFQQVYVGAWNSLEAFHVGRLQRTCLFLECLVSMLSHSTGGLCLPLSCHPVKDFSELWQWGTSVGWRSVNTAAALLDCCYTSSNILDCTTSVRIVTPRCSLLCGSLHPSKDAHYRTVSHKSTMQSCLMSRWQSFFCFLMLFSISSGQAFSENHDFTAEARSPGTPNAPWHLLY